MFYDAGCYGRVVLGSLPEAVQQRLGALPGEWLEYDLLSGTIVVRHIQPTAGPSLPTVTAELVRMLGELPEAAQDGVPGGDLFVHTEDAGQLVRLRVEPGGALKIEWAHPDYRKSKRQLYTGARLEMVEPHVQRLNGGVTFESADPTAAAQQLEAVADGYEGLYPEGDLQVRVDRSTGRVTAEVRDLNVDALLLVGRLQQLAAPGSLSGDLEVSSFASIVPEQQLRFVFDDGQTWVQRPVLWEDASRAPAAAGQ